MLANLQFESPLNLLTATVDSGEIAFIQKEVRNVHVDKSLRDYMVKWAHQDYN